MKPHDILRCYLATNLAQLGLKHLRSEMPLPRSEKRKDIIDIVCCDEANRIPILIELKTLDDVNARNTLETFKQMNRYLDNFSKSCATTHKQLYYNRYGKPIDYDYKYGIVGVVLSPYLFNLNTQISNITKENSIIWVTYNLNQDNIFSVIEKYSVSIGNRGINHLDLQSNVERQYPSILTDGSKYLSDFIERLDREYSKILKGSFWYHRPDYNYIAYQPTDTMGVILGFNGNSKKIRVEFHVNKSNHNKFKEHIAVSELKKIGYEMMNSKDKIFKFEITDNSCHDILLVNTLLQYFVALAKRSYELAKIQEIHNFGIDENALNALCWGRLVK